MPERRRVLGCIALGCVSLGCIALGCIALALSCPASAWAAPPMEAPVAGPAKGGDDALDVALGVGTEACPDAERIRARFVEASTPSSRPTTAHPRISIEREGDEYVARVTVEDRVRTVRSPDCEELASSAAWIAALTMTALSRRDEVAPAEEPVLPDESRHATPAVAPPKEEARGDGAAKKSAGVARSRERPVELTAAALVGGGYVPDVWPGLSLGAAFRRSWWSIGGEARLYPRKALDLAWSGGGAVVEVSAILSSTVACLRWSPVRSLGLEGCSTFAIGMDVIETSGLPVSHTVAQPVVYIGGRTAVELRPVPALSFALSGTLEGGAVTTKSVFFDGPALRSAWDAPLFAGAGGFETRAHF